MCVKYRRHEWVLGPDCHARFGASGVGVCGNHLGVVVVRIRAVDVPAAAVERHAVAEVTGGQMASVDLTAIVRPADDGRVGRCICVIVGCGVMTGRAEGVPMRVGPTHRVMNHRNEYKEVNVLDFVGD